MKKLLMLILTMSLLLVIAACGNDDNDNEEAQVEEGIPFEVTDEEIVPEDEVVLTVNGDDVLGEKYNPVYFQTKQRMFQFGYDISDLESVQEQTYSELIAQELIRQDAEASGVEVDSEDVEAELNELRSESEEDLDAYLEQFGLTEDEFKEQIRFTLLANQYIESLPTGEVTDEEIQEMYDLLKEQNEDMVEFEEIEDVIRQQLLQQKQSEQLQARLEELESEAEIEKLL